MAVLVSSQFLELLLVSDFNAFVSFEMSLEIPAMVIWVGLVGALAQRLEQGTHSFGCASLAKANE